MFAAATKAGGSFDPQLDFITTRQVDGSASSTPSTWSSISVGDFNKLEFLVICGFLFSNSGSRRISSITVNGVSASLVAESFGPVGDTYSAEASIFITPAPSSTVEVILSVSGNTESRGIALYKLKASSINAFSTANNFVVPNTSNSLNITSPFNSAVLACSIAVNGSNPNWTNLTKDFGIDLRSSEWASGASIDNNKGSSPIAVASSSRAALSIACWQ